MFNRFHHHHKHDLLVNLPVEALEEAPDFPGSFTVELDAPLAANNSAGLADSLPESGGAVQAVEETAVGYTEFGLNLHSSPAAEMAVDEPHWSHDGMMRCCRQVSQMKSTR